MRASKIKKKRFIRFTIELNQAMESRETRMLNHEIWDPKKVWESVRFYVQTWFGTSTEDKELLSC